MLQCEDQSAWTESVTRHLLAAGLFQVKNTAALAHALAITKGVRLSYARVSQALTVNGYSIPDLSDTSVDHSLYEN
jgi:hypothetical protein